MMGLSTLIKLRENKRDERRLFLTESEKKAAALQNHLAGIDASLAENLKNRQGLISAVPLPIDALRLLQNQRDELIRVRTELVKKLSEAESEIFEARTNLNEAVRDLRILENLQSRKETGRAEEEKKRNEKYNMFKIS